MDLTPPEIDALTRIDTCTVANAIEQFDVRMRNEGFADRSLRSLYPPARPMVGYAATVRIRGSNPPMQGHAYHDRTDLWTYLLTLPAPRVVVIQDIDEKPGFGGFVGEVHAHILKALGCVGVVTNGTIRDLPAIEETGLAMFGSGVAVSHAYVHIVDFGHPVEVGGLKVRPGDLLHGDLHGVLSVPRDFASKIPIVADALTKRERRVIDLCQGPDFSLEKLRQAVAGVFN
jgi:4-hydroxy-4-methyl-2-oxoglutarate aldolase